ncbi:MAG: hypothetical protein K2K48_06345 [Anaeroplasmataceae bacterium]|nr:hypothetical protein [Anaeroplasmataceae bacterium]
MEKQNTPMLKKIATLFLVLFIGLLTACTQKIPEGDIKNFVDRINYNTAYEQIETGISQVTAVFSQNDEELGRVSIHTEIDKNKKYYYVNTEASGSYIEEYGFQAQQILSYVKQDNTIQSYQAKNDEPLEVSHNEEELNQLILSFFYTRVDGGYHQGAMYYGDYVITNCGKYYSCFSLNEEQTLLTYEVNTSQKNSEGDEIVTMHHFVINAYGMLLSLHTKSIMVEKNIVIDTTIECEYNIQIDKKIEL